MSDKGFSHIGLFTQRRPRAEFQQPVAGEDARSAEPNGMTYGQLRDAVTALAEDAEIVAVRLRLTETHCTGCAALRR